MSRTKSSKQLIFMYFSVVAFAIITVHLFAVESTISHLEGLNGQIRLEIARDALRTRAGTWDQVELPPHTALYLTEAALPSDVSVPDSLPFDRAYEVIVGGETSTSLYVMKSHVEISGQTQAVFLTNVDPIFERSEDSVDGWVIKQLLVSVALLIVSLWVVLKISVRLATPLSSMTEQLMSKKAEDFRPITLPATGRTLELVQLAESLNGYQAQIKSVLERERSFNRFASHELRTPLMVIKGGLSLLKQSSERAFVERQHQRMATAVKDMEGYVQTLLSLTRAEQEHDETWQLTKSELRAIIAEHEPLLVNKDVVCDLKVIEEPWLRAPEAAVKILLGNLLKNAFSYTDAGKVDIVVAANSVVVKDTGRGMLEGNAVQGHGLGLVLARDICRKYGWVLDIESQVENGSVVRVSGFLADPDV